MQTGWPARPQHGVRRGAGCVRRRTDAATAGGETRPRESCPAPPAVRPPPLVIRYRALDTLPVVYLLNLLLPFWLATAPGPVRAQEAVSPATAERQKRVDGVEVVFGIVPAARAVPAHQQNPGGRAHGGTPPDRASYHIDIALFDAASRARITDARVWATVRELNTAGKRKQLDAETFGNALSYGNYFTLHGEGPFRIAVEARLPGRKQAVETEFEYRTR